MIGLGLIGGSIGLALRDAGWHVTGDDIDPGRRRARRWRRGCVDAAGLDPAPTITFVAVPVLAVADQVKRALAETTGVVTDVGSVKGAIAAAVDDPRFVGGHPMAGSELDGLDGADGAMFRARCGCSRPSPTTADATFATVAGVVAELGAEVVALAPERHDEMVAVVSHVPHLTAATLMGLAADRGRGARRAAAPGRRRLPRHDPHRQRASRTSGSTSAPRTARPSCRRSTRLIDRLGEMREIVGTDDRGELHGRLQRARDARTNLPSRVTHPEELAEVRIPIPDRTGAAAEVFTLAAELGVNIASFEVVHMRREQPRRRRRARRRRRRRPLPRRADRPRLPPRRHAVSAERAAADGRVPGRARRRSRSTRSSHVPGLEEHRQPGARLRRAGRR